MLDIRFIVANPNSIKDDLKKRQKADRIWIVDELVQQYDIWRRVKANIDDLRRKRNELSLQVNKLKKEKKDASQVLKQVQDIPQEISQKEQELAALEKNINEKIIQIPNVTHSSVPKGKDETENKVIRKIGAPAKFSFELKNHVDLAEKLGIADFEAARQVSGEGFNYLLKELALLDLAIQRYGIDFAQKHKFNIVAPPILVNKKAMSGVVNFTDFQDTIYKVENEDLYLVGTAENSLVSLFMNRTLNEKDLPIRIAALTPCFRRELGAHGVDTKGLFRMHQFYKVEQVVFSNSQDSYKILEEMQKISEKFFESLKIPIRTIAICSGDLGNKQAKQYDIEAWFPRQKAYKEVTSASNCTDYQARALNIKYQKGNEREYVHILNNTMVATSRAMVAILENFQQKDDSVKIPAVLQKYTGFKKIEAPR